MAATRSHPRATVYPTNMKRLIRFPKPVGVAQHFWDSAIRDYHEPPNDIIELTQYLLRLRNRAPKAEVHFDAATWGPAGENVRFCLRASRVETGRLVVVFRIGRRPLHYRAYKDHAIFSEGLISLPNAKEALRWGATALATRARFPANPQGHQHGPVQQRAETPQKHP
jgi:hypothetical protein